MNASVGWISAKMHWKYSIAGGTLQWICVTMCCLSLKSFLSCKPVGASRGRIISVDNSNGLSLK